MNDFRARAYRTEDAAAVADLLNAVAKAGGGHLELPAAAIENVVRAQVKDLARDTRVITDAQGRLLAAALVRLPPEGGFRVSLTGGVHPDRRGLGMGRELLAWQLDRAAERHGEAAPDAEWLAEVDAGVPDAAAIRLYERLGFARERFFLEMAAPTSSPPVAPPVDGLRIVPYAPDRERELHAVHSAAFRATWGHQERSFESWAAVTVRSQTFLPEVARLALAGDEVVGYVLPYADAPQALYIGEVGTATSWRRRGVAGALLTDVLDAAGRSGYAEAALETDADSSTGASSVYEKAGFVVKHRVVVYRKPL
ncbi:GNAT family N-acetyltransferase [Kitasatospora sp. NBC_01287]|uniref:GNAT family N-acetyltransferase n=1 Tax=Kitasatospora sp. NBC_01287 TaxID=2903573 RepID=UPI00224EF8CE|nr:GNAT family N-acetyltransferase [Kitasatospora sp. NBC_01287]MCX4751050.1 GNAT family N-acetyltransferase [Kitasatospora sp. NBC_01287]